MQKPMVGSVISHYRILEKLGEGGTGVVYRAQDLMLNRLDCFEASPKGMDIPTEGNALGSDLLGIITTLKGLNTRGAYATITC